LRKHRPTRDALEFALTGEKTTDQLLPDLTLLPEKLFCRGKDYRDFRILDTKRRYIRMAGRNRWLHSDEVKESRDPVECLALANTVTNDAQPVKHRTNLRISNSYDKSLCL
jgi:hypothetical protein